MQIELPCNRNMLNNFSTIGVCTPPAFTHFLLFLFSTRQSCVELNYVFSFFCEFQQFESNFHRWQLFEFSLGKCSAQHITKDKTRQIENKFMFGIDARLLFANPHLHNAYICVFVLQFVINITGKSEVPLIWKKIFGIS